MDSVWMLSLLFILFTRIGSVILKHWFKIGVAQCTPQVRHVGCKQTRPDTRKEMWFISTDYVSVAFPVSWYPASAQCWRKPCVFMNRAHRLGKALQRTRCRGTSGFFAAFPTVLQSNTLQQKKPITSVSFQELSFRSWVNLMDSVY